MFFCYRLPVFVNDDWTTDGGPCRWLLLDTADDGKILEEPTEIAAFIRSTPKTPRVIALDAPLLLELRKRAELHLKNSYMKSLQIPLTESVSLLCWMELN